MLRNLMISVFVTYYGTVAHLNGHTEHPTFHVMRMFLQGRFHLSPIWPVYS